MKNSLKISVVSPVYGAEALVEELVRRVSAAVATITRDFEIVLVEDCSPDCSWERISRICQENPQVVGIRLSRNFGQHNAIAAGLEHSRGEWVVVMDCDLQDVPEEIPNLYRKAQEGFDLVQARRVDRQDSFWKRWSSQAFFAVLSFLTGAKYDGAVSNFGIYSRKVINAICGMKEHLKCFPIMVKWVGFHGATLDTFHAARPEGASSYNFPRLVNLALDIILMTSDKPLRLTVKTGFLISFGTVVLSLIYVVRALHGDFSVMGYASIIISIWFLSGLTIFSLGLTGLYVGKTFEGTKRRPPFIVDLVLPARGLPQDPEKKN